jgi:uncharacterized protein
MIGQLNRQDAELLLLKQVVGRIGCNDGFNTYIYPVNYLFDGKHIVCHSLWGAKIQVMRLNKRVCFLVDEIIDFMNWKSVMVLGEYQEIEEERDRYQAMKAFVDRRLYIKINETSIIKDTQNQANLHQHEGDSKPVIYRIVPEEITGRYENG